MEHFLPEHEPPKESYASIETERKFLVAALPDNLHEFKHQTIRQGYLVIGEDGSEARLRDRAGRFSLTVKSAGTLSRGEWSLELTEKQFAALWPATAGKQLEKTRFEIPYGQWLVELDVYGGHLTDLVIGEVEFNSEAEAEQFQPPGWFGQEVTGVKDFKNQKLASSVIPLAP